MVRFNGRFGFLLLFAIALVSMSACVPEPVTVQVVSTAEPIPVHLWLGIEDGAEPVADFILERYQVEGVVLHVVSGSGPILLDDLGADQVDVAFVYQVPERWDGWFNPVLLDGVVLVVHQDNPVQGVSRQAAQEILAGQIKDWADVGGPVGEIVLHGRAFGSGGRSVLTERVLESQRWAITAEIEVSEYEMMTAVAADPAAIGYGMMGSVARYDGVRPLVIDGIPAEPNTVGTQQYLLTTPLYATTLIEPQGELRALLSWLQSPEIQAELGQVYGRVR